jgi:hypothetical protein
MTYVTVDTKPTCTNQILKDGQEPYSLIFLINIRSVIRVCIYTATATMSRYGVNVQQYREPGSSVSIVSGYGPDDRAIEVRSPAEAGGFFP